MIVTIIVPELYSELRRYLGYLRWSLTWQRRFYWPHSDYPFFNSYSKSCSKTICKAVISEIMSENTSGLMVWQVNFPHYHKCFLNEELWVPFFFPMLRKLSGMDLFPCWLTNIYKIRKNLVEKYVSVLIIIISNIPLPCITLSSPCENGKHTELIRFNCNVAQKVKSPGTAK